MTRRERRQRVRELAERYKKLPSEDVAYVGVVLLVNALISMVLQIALLGMYVRTVRRLWKNRHQGVRATAGSLSRTVVLCTCSYACYAVLSRALLLRWARRVVERAEHDAETPENRPFP